MNAPTTSTWARWPSLLIFLALAAAAASLGSAYGPDQWYRGLEKPAFNPPNWIFPLVWTPLYVLIAIAGWWIWSHGRRSAALPLWFLQLALNAAWTWLFFGRHAIGAALINIIALEAVIVAIIAVAWRPPLRSAAIMFLPYAAWVAFATLLNAAFWQLNM
jgi:benzodiazapine receptor